MTQIIARGSKDSTVNLYARLYKRPTLNKTVAIGISLDVHDWQIIETMLKNAEAAQKMGSTIVLRDSLAIKLWDIKTELDYMIDAGIASVEAAKNTITQILRPDIINKVESLQAEEELRQEKEKRTTLIEWIETFIRQCETGERLKRKSTRTITDGTIKSYKGTLAQIKAYQEKRHRIVDFDDVTLDFYDDWRRFFLQKTDARGNLRPYSPNTIGRHVRNLKIFLYAAKDMKLTTNTEFENSRFSADSQPGFSAPIFTPFPGSCRRGSFAVYFF